VSGTSARRLDPASSRHTQAGIEGTDSWLASRHGGSIQNNPAIDSAPAIGICSTRRIRRRIVCEPYAGDPSPG
jgi:hypothetical protein